MFQSLFYYPSTIKNLRNITEPEVFHFYGK